ncbi:MAG: urease accessory protein UreD [Bacteroidota bacterium]
MIAQLHIRACLRNGITYLKHCYATPPFKLADITEDKKANELQLMLMCSSPGILDGDSYSVKLELEENCNMQLHTQSYQRLFQMKEGAKQLMEVTLQAGASLVYLPHPAVPHATSIFSSVNKIFLQQKCSLIWGEILTCGRQLKSEYFSYSKYHSITEVYIDNRLVVKENLLMQPAMVNVNAIGQLEGYSHQASLLCIYDNEYLPGTMDAIYDFLVMQPAIEFGISKTPLKGFIVRILGFKAEQLHHLLKSVADLVKVNNACMINNK